MRVRHPPVSNTTGVRPAAATKRHIDNELMKALLRDNPWLSEADFTERKGFKRRRVDVARRPKLKPEDVPDPPLLDADPPDASEDGELDVKEVGVDIDGKAGLAAIRAEDHYDWADFRFYRFVYYGGDWTAEFCSVASNACWPRQQGVGHSLVRAVPICETTCVPFLGILRPGQRHSTWKGIRTAVGVVYSSVYRRRRQGWLPIHGCYQGSVCSSPRFCNVDGGVANNAQGVFAWPRSHA